MNRCHCGCAADAHFKDHKGIGSCLVMRCDCPRYRDETKPNPIKPPRPKHAAWCKCLACNAADSRPLTDTDLDAMVDTPRMPNIMPPWYRP